MGIVNCHPLNLITFQIKVTTCIYLVYFKMANKRNPTILMGMRGTCNTTKYS